MVHAACLSGLKTQYVRRATSRQAKDMLTTPSLAIPIGHMVILAGRGSVKEPELICFQGEMGGAPHAIRAPSELNGPS